MSYGQILQKDLTLNVPPVPWHLNVRCVGILLFFSALRTVKKVVYVPGPMYRPTCSYAMFMR